MVADSVTLSEPIKPRVKRSYKETRELAALPLRIEALETEQRTIATQLNEGAIYRTDPARARELNERNAVIELELIECLQRWETLEGRQ